MVAVGILAIVLSFAGIIFRVGIDSQRMAVANMEIMQKLRAITDQINADFRGLRKDGEIFVVWLAEPRGPVDPDTDRDAHIRFDRIMFFADGDFQSYTSNPKVIRGNLARICYMVANEPPPAPGAAPTRPIRQEPRKRKLARTQHILTADTTLGDFWSTFTGLNQQWLNWNNRLEYEKIASLELWKNIPWVIDPTNPSEPNKANMLAVIADVRVANRRFNEDIRGARINPADPNTIHMLLCDGVGEFMVQGWYDKLQRWVPEVDPNADGSLADTDFIRDPVNPAILAQDEVPGLLYPFPPYGGLTLGGVFAPGKLHEFPRQWLDQRHFNAIPGLGRALKFTFTLYDSKGVIEKGRTFTHIVYLDN
jgi:hypothetical protein